jgi:hypothetical protein
MQEQVCCCLTHALAYTHTPVKQGPNYAHLYMMPRPGLPMAGPSDVPSAVVATAAAGSAMSDAGEAAAARIADTSAAGMAPGPTGGPVPASAPQDPRRPPSTSITGGPPSLVPKPLAAQAQPPSRPQDPRLAGRHTPPPPPPVAQVQAPRPTAPRAGAPPPTIKDPKAWSLDNLMSEGGDVDAAAWMGGAGDTNKQPGAQAGVQQTLLGGPLAAPATAGLVTVSQPPTEADIERIIHMAMHTLVTSNPVLAGVLTVVVDLMTAAPEYQRTCASVIQVRYTSAARHHAVTHDAAPYGPLHDRSKALWSTHVFHLDEPEVMSCLAPPPTCRDASSMTLLT